MNVCHGVNELAKSVVFHSDHVVNTYLDKYKSLKTLFSQKNTAHTENYTGRNFYHSLLRTDLVTVVQFSWELPSITTCNEHATNIS